MLILTVLSNGIVDVVYIYGPVNGQRIMLAPWSVVLATINPLCPIRVRRQTA